jgi:hypothetical protein
VPAGWIVTRCDTVRAIGNGITAVPWERLVDRSIPLWTA